MKKPAKGLLSLCAMFLVCGPADAGYVGFGIGQSTVQDWNGGDLAFDGSSVTGISSEDSDTGFRIVGGFDVTPNLAVEIGYSDFGEATADGTSDGSGFFWSPGPVSVKAAVDGIDFGFAGQLPASESFSLLARVGVLLWDLEAELADSSGSFSGSDDGNDVFFGIGAQFNTTGPLSMRAEFTRYAVDDIDLDSISFSLIYRVGP